MSKKIIIYGSSECGPCMATKALFDKEGIRYGFVDVLGGLAHLKKYLNVRDAHPELYEEIKAEHRVGIPTIVVDDTEIYVGEVTEDKLELFR